LANKIDNLVEKSWAETQVSQGFQAIESAHDGIAIIDDDGEYQYLNEAYAEVYDRERTEILDQHWRMLYPDDEVDRFDTEILPSLWDKGVWRGSATGITKQGDEVPERLVLNSMDDGGHVCIVQDLTEEDRLKADLAVKNQALDAASIGVVITDPSQEDNPIVEMNDGFVQMTGYEREEILGRNCRFLQGPETDQETVSEIHQAVENGEPITTEILNYKADGTPFWNLLEIAPVRDDEETIRNFIGLQHDITTRKNYTEKVEGELAWLSGFGDILSHDLKTPLSIIDSNIKLAKERGEMDRLEKAQNAVNRLNELIDDLTNVMKQADLVEDLEPVELEDAFRSWDSFETPLESLEITGSKEILADEMAIKRLADNLVKNTVEHGDADVPMRVGVLPGGFYYEDDGPGIPKDEREDVFQHGYTTKQDGTGFGMVSIKQIALAHGWSMSIEESRTGGARFEFTGVESP
jgi:PAS domain S-box-containing protein